MDRDSPKIQWFPTLFSKYSAHENHPNCFAKAHSEPERNEDLNIVRSSVRLFVCSCLV